LYFLAIMSNKSEQNPKEPESTDTKEKEAPAPATPSGDTTPTAPATPKEGIAKPHFDKGITQR
jgi:hypothetical protein